MREPGQADLPFVAGPPHSIDAVLSAAERAASFWGLPDPTVMRIGINGVFACDDVVLRVSEPTVPATASIELAEVMESIGVRVPAPHAGEAFDAGGGVWVTSWERIDHDPNRFVDWATVGSMVRRVHDLSPDHLPPNYPLPWCAGFPWWHFDRLISGASAVIDDAALVHIVECVRRNRWAIDQDVVGEHIVCHGDVHPGNVLVDGDGPVLIDWDLLCWGPPGWDHAPLMTWTERWGGRPGLYEEFAVGYGRDLREDPVAVALSELRLVAATFGRAQAAVRDASARQELDDRLRWWRGEPDAPRWIPQ